MPEKYRCTGLRYYLSHPYMYGPLDFEIFSRSIFASAKLDHTLLYACAYPDCVVRYTEQNRAEQTRHVRLGGCKVTARRLSKSASESFIRQDGSP